MSDGRSKSRTVTLGGPELLERWIMRGRMTQAEAADRIGISRVQLNQYLHGVSVPGLATAIRIEDATGIGIRTWLTDSPKVADGRIGERDPAETLRNIPVCVGQGKPS